MDSRLNPHPWFNSTQRTRGLIHGRDFPKLPPLKLIGAVQVVKGSPIVRGVGTRFLAQVDPAGPGPYFNGRLRIRESNGTYRQVQVAAVQSDIQMTLTAPYGFASQAGVQADTFYSDGPNNNWDIYMNANYYDLALCLYALYYRTGDDAYLQQARKVADSWWLSSPINGGAGRDFENASYSPRNSSLGGLMLRALDGRPEMWDWLRTYTRYQFDIWVKLRIKDPQPYLGVRDGSFMLLYATWLGKVLPDSFPLQSGGAATNGAALRAEFLADAGNAALNYYGRLQYADGSWRWDDPYYTDADGGTLKGVTQPFMVGLLLQALIDVHRASGRADVKESVKNQLAKACRHLYQDGPYRLNDVALPGIRWRAYHYFYHGGTTVNPTKYVNGSDSAFVATAPWEVTSARQLIATSLPAYGYTYQITGDGSFKTMGDELFEAAFGNITDGVHDEAAGSTKNYNQNYRMGGRYLVWRVGPQDANASAVKDIAAVESTGSNTITSTGDLVRAAFSTAAELAALPSLNVTGLSGLVQQIEVARQKVKDEQAQYLSPDAVVTELEAALGHARNALMMMQRESAAVADAKTRLEWSAARLKRASERLKRK